MTTTKHITADIPETLVRKVDKQVKRLGVSRSFAIRQGLQLFLTQYRQDLTKNVKVVEEVTE